MVELTGLAATPPLATKTFGTADQVAFARLSGDYNPMHMDEAVARKTQAGTRAVHGVHGLLWSLEQLAKHGEILNTVTSIRAQFTKFIGLGPTVEIHIASRTSDTLRVVAQVEGANVIVVALSYKAGKSRAVAPPSFPEVVFSVTDGPINHDFTQLADVGGWLNPPQNADAFAGKLFPSLCASFGPAFVASVALTSTIVGMVTPGLHSIFSSLSLNLLPSPALPHALGFRTTRVDERFRLVHVAFEAADFHGDLSAFMRYPPIESPALSTLRDRVSSTSFVGRKALVVGGSRGIGAAIAKLVAAGGGQSLITYVSGREEALKVQSDINSDGDSLCHVAEYNVSNSDHIRNLGDLRRFTHIYYCATSRISTGTEKIYDREKLLNYLAVYVDGLEHLITALLKARDSESPLTVLYPSTVFVDERPKHMTEYAMVKAAGELLCHDLAKGYPQLSISTPRLPRMLTDQTAVVPPVGTLAQPVDILLPLLLAEQ